jgi:hypothetical protein
MRCAFTLVLLPVLAACSSTPRQQPAPLGGQALWIDTDGDGLPDQRLPDGATPPVGAAVFTDTNGDGLPDARLPAPVHAPRDR